jgi:hypothetical protein
MLIESLEMIQQKVVIMMDNEFSLTALTLVLSILLFYRSVALRKRSTKQSILLAEQSKHLAEIQTKLDQNNEYKEREEHFKNNLEQAEMATELNKSRSSYLPVRNNQRPPERYEYAKSMFQSGMATEEISSTLGMSNIEIGQLIKLSALGRQSEQFDNDEDILSLA